MSKTAAQKARRKEKKAAQKQKKNVMSNPKPKGTVKKGKKKKGKSKNGGMKRQRGLRRSNAAYRLARFGTSEVSDGISIMRTVHNGSVIEDTFAVRREKISNVVGTTATSLNINHSLYVNPGNSVLFPIFSRVASTYEQFRVNNLVFSYETEAYAASGTNVSAGKVILATNYDPADTDFTTDTEMENYFNSDRGVPFCEIIHDVMEGDHALKDDPLKNYYVNYSANLIAPTTDSTNNKFYDVGKFQLATQGNASSSAEIGELYVTYSFTMIRPKQPTNSETFTSLVAHIIEDPVGSAAAAGSNFLGTTGGSLKAGSTLSSVATKTTFTLPVAGRFQVTYLWVNGVTNVASFTLGANITEVSMWQVGSPGSDLVQSGTNTGGSHIYDVSASGTGAGNTITISGLTALAAGNCDIFINQLPVTLTLVNKESRLEALERKLERMAILLERAGCDDPIVVEEAKSPDVTPSLRAQARAFGGALRINPLFR